MRLFKANTRDTAPDSRTRPTVKRTSRADHILHLQRTIGNQATQRYIQRAPPTEEAEFNAPISPEQNRENWDAIVAAELDRYLQEFMNIPIRVSYEEDGQTVQTVVYVHPPYFMTANAGALENTKKRYDTAMENRKGASKEDRKAYGAASGPAKFGKARRDEIKLILETALANGAIATPPGKKHPDSGDLRDWLVKYGISVDCSGFVAYAINQVMGHMHVVAGVEGEFDTFSGSGSQLGASGNKRLSSLETPAELRPGTIQHMPGHVRIVMTAERDGDAMIFTTAESTAGRGALHDEEGGESVKDVGPRRARWKYEDASKPFTDQALYFDRGDGTWVREKVRPVYSRVKAMDEFQDSNQPALDDFAVIDFGDEYGTLVTAAEQTVEEANAAGAK